MFKKKFYLAFVLMFIATLILTTMTSDANEELFAQRRANRRQTTRNTRKSNTRKSQGYPSWIKWSWKYRIIRDNNGHNKFKIDITYRNNSKDKIIKCFFNRNLNLSFKQCVWGYGSQEIKYKGQTYCVVSNCTSNAVSYPKSANCEIYPGDSYTLTYNIPFSRFNWKEKYNPKRHKLLNFKLSHTFQVRKENMDAE